jgi:hypothetical protein
MAILKQLARYLGPPAMAVALCGSIRAEATAALTEAQVKAGLLYNFATFVEWPDSANAGSRPFLMCVQGADDVAEALRSIEGQGVRGRKLEIRRVTEETDPRACNVLFMATPSAETAKVLADMKESQVLTVGEHEQFSRMGGVIRLFPERSRIRFEIDVARADRAGLKISSKLLGLARLVKDGNVVKP